MIIEYENLSKLLRSLQRSSYNVPTMRENKNLVLLRSNRDFQSSEWFVLILYILVNNFSVMLGRVFLG